MKASFRQGILDRSLQFLRRWQRTKILLWITIDEFNRRKIYAKRKVELDLKRRFLNILRFFGLWSNYDQKIKDVIDCLVHKHMQVSMISMH